MSETTGIVTEWLDRLRKGEPGAEQALMDLLYTDLHRLARKHMGRERAWHTIQPTALVNEAYLKLIDRENRNWNNKAHFMAAAASAMRRILIDYARTRVAEKHGGNLPHVPLDENSAITTQRPEELLALDRAMDSLAEFDPELARLVELRFFGGLTEDEVAAVTGVCVRTIKRRWSTAKAWLFGELSDGGKSCER